MVQVIGCGTVTPPEAMPSIASQCQKSGGSSWQNGSDCEAHRSLPFDAVEGGCGIVRHSMGGSGPAPREGTAAAITIRKPLTTSPWRDRALCHWASWGRWLARKTLVVMAFPGHGGGRVENPLTRALDERGKYRAPFYIASFCTASSPPLPSPTPPPLPRRRRLCRLLRRAAPSTIRRRFSASSTSTATLSPWRHTIAATPTPPMKTGGEHRSGGRGRSNSIFLGFFFMFQPMYVSLVESKCCNEFSVMFHYFFGFLMFQPVYPNVLLVESKCCNKFFVVFHSFLRWIQIVDVQHL